MDAIWYSDQAQDCIRLAESLGEKKLLILFSKDLKSNNEQFEALSSTGKLIKGLFVTSIKDAQKARKNYEVLVAPATRECIESRIIDYVCCAELEEGKDKTHHRLGFNQVLAKLIAERKIYIFSVEELLSSTHQATILGRMKQNKTVLKKYSATMEMWSLAKTPLDLRAPKERQHFLQQL